MVREWESGPPSGRDQQQSALGPARNEADVSSVPTGHFMSSTWRTRVAKYDASGLFTKTVGRAVESSQGT